MGSSAKNSSGGQPVYKTTHGLKKTIAIKISRGFGPEADVNMKAFERAWFRKTRCPSCFLPRGRLLTILLEVRRNSVGRSHVVAGAPSICGWRSRVCIVRLIERRMMKGATPSFSSCLTGNQKTVLTFDRFAPDNSVHLFSSNPIYARFRQKSPSRPYLPRPLTVVPFLPKMAREPTFAKKKLKGPLSAKNRRCGQGMGGENATTMFLSGTFPLSPWT